MANGRLNLTRDQLAAFLKDHQSIKQFELLFKTVGAIGENGFAEVGIAADNAASRSQQALDALNRIADALELLALAPAFDFATSEQFTFPTVEHIDSDNLMPPIQVGTLGQQQAERVAITGGTIDGTTVGATTPAAGSFTDLSVSGTGGNVYSGTWTPTVTKVTNAAEATAAAAQFTRVRNVVTFSGQMTIDPTDIGKTAIRLSLPVASNFAASRQAAGTFAAADFADENVGAILADGTNDELLFRYMAKTTANTLFSYSGSYLIV